MKKSGPKTLSAEARRWWLSLVREYQIGDQGGLLLLQTALEAFDEMKVCQKQIQQEGRTLTDRFGQIKPHPLLPALRDARSQLIQALKVLNLDAVPPDVEGDDHGATS